MLRNIPRVRLLECRVCPSSRPTAPAANSAWPCAGGPGTATPRQAVAVTSLMALDAGATPAIGRGGFTQGRTFLLRAVPGRRGLTCILHLAGYPQPGVRTDPLAESFQGRRDLLIYFGG
jgi:hypothetical protein